MVHALRAASILSLFVALLAASPAAAQEPAGQAEAPWFDQLGELAYQLYLNSNVNQKAVVGNFSCCLLPPKNMSDPVRVGQSSVAGWQEEMLEKARKVGPSLWPLARRITLDKVLQAERLKNPGLTEAQADAVRARVGEVLDNARGLGEMEFQLEKTRLCEAMGLGPPQAGTGPEALKRFHRAFFLILPGSKDAYVALIKRLDEAPVLKPKDLEKEPGAAQGGT